MITLLSNDFTDSVKFAKQALQDNLIDCTLIVGNNQTLVTALHTAVKTSKAVVVFGDHNVKNLVAQTFSLSMGYDKFAEKNIEKLCNLTKQSMPPQYLLDMLCALPETFVHYACNFCPQAACFGEINKTGVFVFPNNEQEVKFVFETYFSPYINKFYPQNTKVVYKIFGLQHKEVLKAVADIATLKNVSCKSITISPILII